MVLAGLNVVSDIDTDALNHKSKTGRAVFLHVPAYTPPETIKNGADVAAAYFGALVDGMSM